MYLLSLPFRIFVYSPTRPNPGGGGETCAETGINIFFTKVGQCNLWSNALELLINRLVGLGCN